MTWWAWILLVLGIVAAWFLWTVLHELSHVAMARIFRKLVSVKFILFPHKDEEGNFYFARVQFWYEGEPLKPVEEAMVNLAPRIMNIAAAIALPFISCFGLAGMLVWGVIWGAGLVDFFVGSLGMSPVSDLQVAAAKLGVNHNVIRVIGFFIILVSLMWTVGNLLAL